MKKLEYETYHSVHSYLKIYPMFSKLIIYKTPIMVKTAGFEEEQKSCRSKNDSTPDPLAYFESLRRTKTTISDITLCNDFDMFATFTFKDDRQNILLIKRRMAQWLKNQKAIHGKFSYLIVPEFHKDGKSIHFHALLKNYQGTLVNSGKRINKRTAYNIKSYRLGFSTIVKIDDINKVSSYVRKYITKDMPKLESKKRYWCSTGLIRPLVVENPTIDPYTFTDFVETWSKENLTILQANYKVQDVTTLSEGINTWQTII